MPPGSGLSNAGPRPVQTWNDQAATYELSLRVSGVTARVPSVSATRALTTRRRKPLTFTGLRLWPPMQGADLHSEPIVRVSPLNADFGACDGNVPFRAPARGAALTEIPRIALSTRQRSAD